MDIMGLKCEYLSDPVGIGVDNPRFSWQLSCNERNLFQAAYQIIVSSCRSKAEKLEADLWDSGRVESSRQSDIAYDGSKLKSSQRCWWRVRCWYAEGICSLYSDIAMFETGLLEKSDWKGQWIGGHDGESGLLYYKAFKTSGSIHAARAYICGLGYYELYLNGCKVGDHVLDPGWTDYGKRDIRDLLYPFDDKTSKRVLYVTYDITELLKEGSNAADVMLGNGWFNQHERNAEGKLWYGEPRYILQINIEYEDGKTETVVSDASWKYRQGPVIFNNIYFGEIYDARLEVDGWNDVDVDVDADIDIDTEDWHNVRRMEEPSGMLTAQMSPPDRVKKDIEPIAIYNTQKGTYVFDMGQNFSGWAQLKAEGHEGTEIRLRFAEEVEEGFMLDFESAGGKDQIQSDTYIMKGTGLEIYEPRFTWHTFRYVEVTGYPGVPCKGSILGRMVHSDVASTGSFECSDTTINKINEVYLRTQLSNFHGGVPSDCPHRERLGYTGDGQITAEACIYNFDMAAFYTKWLEDIADAQNHETGFVPHTAPFYGGGGGPAWGCAYIINAWCMYLYYGDRKILRSHYDGMKKWLEYLDTRTKGSYIIRVEEPGGWFLGDWCAPDEIKLPPELVSTFYYLKCMEIMVDISRVLDFKGDSTFYKELCLKIAAAYNSEFLDKTAGKYSIGRQGADVFPLAAGIVPDDYKDKVLKSLLANIESNDFHFDTGIFATPLMLQVLSENGFIDAACKILTRKGFPGYVYMLEKGATTLWECWDGSYSHCHPMFGGVSAWFYKVLAGINPDPAYPAFERIIFKPHVDAGLSYVKASLETLRGRIAIEWSRTREGFDIQIVIPANSSAIFESPKGMNIEMFAAENGTIFERNIAESAVCEGLIVHWTDGRVIVKLGSGCYRFGIRQ